MTANDNDFDTRYHLPKLDYNDLRLLKFAGAIEGGAMFEELAYKHAGINQYRQRLEPFHIANFQRWLNKMIQRGLLEIALRKHGDSDEFIKMVKPTAHGYYSELWLTAKDDGIPAMLAAKFGLYALRQGEGVFNMVQFTDDAWNKSFVVVDDDTLKRWWSYQDSLKTNESDED